MLQLRAIYYSVNGYEQLNVIHTPYFWKVFGQALQDLKYSDAFSFFHYLYNLFISQNVTFSSVKVCLFCCITIFCQFSIQDIYYFDFFNAHTPNTI